MFSSLIKTTIATGGAFIGLKLKKTSFADGACWNYDWDQKEALTPSKEAGECAQTYTRDILLVSHGDTRLTPSLDPGLSSMGIKQAVKLGAFLASEGLHERITQVHVSDTKRTRETWKYIRKEILETNSDSLCKINIMLENDLKDGFPGVPNPPSSVNEFNLSHHYLVGGVKMCESFKRFIHRPSKQKNSVELFICHPNVVRYFVAKVLQVPEIWSRLYLAPCAVTHLKIADDGVVTLGSFNNGAFLSKDLNPLD